VAVEVAKTYPNLVMSRRTIQLNKVLNGSREENAPLFDRDMGESSKDRD